jgi:hypothetical protein
MLRKLSTVLAFAFMSFALMWLVAPVARAEEANDAQATEEASDSDAAADEDSAGYDRDGWYTGVGGGYAIEYFDNGTSGNSGFAQIRAGYHFLRFAALEAELEYTPKFNGDSGRYAGVDTATFAAWANIKGYPTAPWTGLFQPYAMIGIGWMWERRGGPAISGVDENGAFASRFGGGVDLYVTKNIVVTAESAWVLPTGHLESLKQVQIGGALQYRF